MFLEENFAGEEKNNKGQRKLFLRVCATTHHRQNRETNAFGFVGDRRPCTGERDRVVFFLFVCFVVLSSFACLRVAVSSQTRFFLFFSPLASRRAVFSVPQQTPNKGDDRKECAEDFNNICKFHAGIMHAAPSFSRSRAKRFFFVVSR